ncbi:MAG: hypothetical protein ABJI60_00760 [Kangiellaceae bacterium]|jgi:hypothetical protein
MNIEVAFDILKNSIQANLAFSGKFGSIKFYPASSRYPRSVTAYYENDFSGGEITVYLNPDNACCEFEMLINSNEKFISENKEFNSKEELAEIVVSFCNAIAGENV